MNCIQIQKSVLFIQSSNFNALTLLVTIYIIQFKLLGFNIKFNIDGIRLFTLHLNETSSFEAEAIVR